MFNVDVSVRDLDGHAVVALRGQLDLVDAQSVASCLVAATTTSGPSVIVDLAALEYIDSSGLGILVRALKRARECCSDLSLAAPQPQVRRILDITGLTSVFSVYPSAEAASAALPRALSGAG